MSYDGYLKWGTTEILNAARVQAYTKASGVNVMQNRKVIADYSTIRAAVGDAEYVSPAADNAPWYDSSDPVTADFLGVFPIKVSNLTESTRTTSVTESLGDGGAPGVARASSREFMLSLGLVANTQVALERGLNWLKQVVDLYDEEVVTTFIAKPDPDQISQTRRTLRDVSVISGPTVIDERILECYSIMQVEIIMNAGTPFLFCDLVTLPLPATPAATKQLWDTDFTSLRNFVQNPSFMLPTTTYWDKFGLNTGFTDVAVTSPLAAPNINRAGRLSFSGTVERGTAGFRYIGNNNSYAAANELYSFQCWVRTTVPKRLYISASITRGTYRGVNTAGDYVDVPANTWRQLKVEGVRPVVSGNVDEPAIVSIDVRDVAAAGGANVAWTTGDFFWVTAVSGHVGAYAFPYFDGQQTSYPADYFPVPLNKFEWSGTRFRSTSVAYRQKSTTLAQITGTAFTDPPVPPQIDSYAAINKQTWLRTYYPIDPALIPDYNPAVLVISFRMYSLSTWNRDGLRFRIIRNPNNLPAPYTGIDDTDVVGEFIVSEWPWSRLAYTDFVFDGRNNTATMENKYTGGTVNVSGDARALLYAPDGGPFVPPVISGTAPLLFCVDIPVGSTPDLDAQVNTYNDLLSVRIARKE